MKGKSRGKRHGKGEKEDEGIREGFGGRRVRKQSQGNGWDWWEGKDSSGGEK